MAGVKIDARQIISRDALDQLKGSANTELDDLLRAINSEITPPLRMDASSPADLTVSIGAVQISDSENNRVKSGAHINGTLPTFTSGSITFPSSSGGTVTISPGTNTTVSITSNNYRKGLIYLKENGDLDIAFGVENATEANATVPDVIVNTYPIGYVTLFNNAGTIDNVSQDKIVQFFYPSGIRGSNSPLDSASGGPLFLASSTKSANYTITDTDNLSVILVDDTSSDRTITLPTATDNTGRFIIIKNVSSDGGKVTVDGEGSETIDDVLTKDLLYINDFIAVHCDGSNWNIVATNIRGEWFSYFNNFVAPAESTDLTQNTITIVDYTNLGSDTWVIRTPQGDVTLTEGTDFTAATSNDATASSLQSAIAAIAGYESSTVDGAVISLVCDYKIEMTPSDNSNATTKINNPNAFEVFFDDRHPYYGEEKLIIEDLIPTGKADFDGLPIYEVKIKGDKYGYWRDKIKAVGSWKFYSAAAGQGIFLDNEDGSYLEVSGRYTDVYLLGRVHSSTQISDFNVYENGVDSGNDLSLIGSGVLLNLSFNALNQIEIKKGFSSGLNSIKLQAQTSGTDDALIFGFIINNSDSSTNIGYTKGDSYISGYKDSHTSENELVKPASYTGEHGARVIQYQTRTGIETAYTESDRPADASSVSGSSGTTGLTVGSGGTVYKNGDMVRITEGSNEEINCIASGGGTGSWTMKNNLSATYTSATIEFYGHTGDSVTDLYSEDIRRIHYREFPEFSSGSGSGQDKAGVLEDGVTSLVGNDLVFTQGYIGNTASAQDDYVIFSAFCSGLRLFGKDYTGTNFMQVIVDGTEVNNFNNQSLSGVAGDRYFDIASDLPLGLHTFKISANIANGNFLIKEFIPLQPKKPVITEDHIELRDYCVLADHVPFTGASNVLKIDQGVVRYHCDRYFHYNNVDDNGDWGRTGYNANIGGRHIYGADQNDYLELTKWCRGFVLRYEDADNASEQVGIKINGLDATTANFANLTTSYSDTDPFNGTDEIDQNEESVTVRDKAVRWIIDSSEHSYHTFRATKEDADSTSDLIKVSAVDIITDCYAPLNEVGGQHYGNVPISPEKALDFQNVKTAKGIISSPTTTSTTPVQMPEMFVEINLDEDRLVKIEGIASCYSSGSYYVLGQCAIDSKLVGNEKGVYSTNPSELVNTWKGSLSKGKHVIQFMWWTSAGTATNREKYRSLIVEY